MESVLLVDDDRLICEDIQMMLQPSFQVLGICGEGRSALSKLEQVSPDIMLTDISMPIMDGVTLVREAHKKWPRMLIVVLSNYDDFQLVKDAMRYGAFDYLLKYEAEAKQLCLKLSELYTAWVEQNGFAKESEDAAETVRVEIQKTIDFIRENYQDNLTLNDVAERVGFSKNYFCKLFKQETGKNFVEFLNGLRIERAKELLSAGNMKTYEVAERVGFRDYRYFCRIFRQYTGRQPAQMKMAKKERAL